MYETHSGNYQDTEALQGMRDLHSRMCMRSLQLLLHLRRLAAT